MITSHHKEINEHSVRLDEFAHRHWDPKHIGTKISIDQNEFFKRAMETIRNEKSQLVDGYAPFCKHLFITNFVGGLKVSAIEITQENEHLLRSDYVQRQETELPILMRWFPKSINVPDAKYLDIILYSKEQIDDERRARAEPEIKDQYEWGIISIKGQLENFEIPMDPITMMRNALGKIEGGSGVPLDHKKYMKSVEYWRHHAYIL